MSLEALLAELDADAAAERDAVLAEARERADAIRAESGRALSRRRRDRLDAAEAEEARKALAEISEARSEARRLVLDARRRLSERVRTEVERRIETSADDPVYLRRLAHELREAIRLASSGRAALRVAPELAGHVERSVSHVEESIWHVGEAISHVDVTPDPDVRSGFLLVADEGRVVVDGTLDARLRLTWPRLAPRVLRELDA